MTSCNKKCDKSLKHNYVRGWEHETMGLWKLSSVAEARGWAITDVTVTITYGEI